MTPRQRRRRDNLLYRLRRHGIRADTRSHTIYIPAGTITTNPKHHLVTCHSIGSLSPGVELETPPFILLSESGDIGIEIYDTDSPMTVKIKEFMALYSIIDIKMRMLKIMELKLIQGFPSDYVLLGTQADQKKFIGNAVEVNVARALCEALCHALTGLELHKTA